MKLPFFIARRYFFSRKNTSAINLISGISVLGYFAGSAALIILLSALNGFEKLIFQVYDTYYPDIKIEAVNGKVMDQDSAMLQKIRNTPGVAVAAFCLEENAIIKSGENQVVGTIKGVAPEYVKVVKTDSLVAAGSTELSDAQGPIGWMAEGMLYKLNVGKEANLVDIMAPNRESFGVTQVETMEDQLRIGSVIKPGEEMNQKLVVTTLAWAQQLFEREGKISSVEIKIKDPTQPGEVADRLQDVVGKKFTVRDRRQQNQAVYKMFNTEKWVAFAIMTFVLLLITFNLVGSLSMLVLEKKRDIKLLDAVGMQSSLIRRIFFSEGVMIALAGSLIGIGAGVLLVWMQQRFGLITTNSTFAVEYPVQLRLSDVLLVTGLCSTLGILGAIYPAMRSAGK